MVVKYPIIIENKENDLDWFASVPDLPGCFATGNGMAQIIDNARTAISLHVRSLRTIPSPSNSLVSDEGNVMLIEVDL